MPEHAVIAYLKLSGDGFPDRAEMQQFHELSDELIEAIEEAAVGEFDGDEFGQGECVLFMYGPDADAIFSAIEPVLRRSPLARGGRVVKRFGTADDPSAKKVSILL